MDYLYMFSMDAYPILHVYVFFVCDVSDVVKEGSHSHSLVGIYMMYHFLPFSIQFKIYVFVHAWILCSL